jgi:hypothetical protein
MFYLTQRIKANTAFGERPFSPKGFSYDYMGSAEFEFGVVPYVIRTMKDSNKYFRKLIVTINGRQKELYMIVTEGEYPKSGPHAGKSHACLSLTNILFDDLHASVQRWIDTGCQGKEYSGLDCNKLSSVAWLSLDHGLFMTFDHPTFDIWWNFFNEPVKES